LISRVAIEMPDRVRRLVYFAAFVPAHGKALVDELPPHLRTALQASAEERKDGSVVLPFFFLARWFLQRWYVGARAAGV
jgi:hypothetical protein